METPDIPPHLFEEQSHLLSATTRERLKRVAGYNFLLNRMEQDGLSEEEKKILGNGKFTN